mgnify:CR=1 FL=1
MKIDLQRLIIVIGLVFVVSLVYKAAFITSYSYGSNYENVTIDTQVNITNAPPTVLTVTIDEEVNGLDNITLSAGQTRSIYCNVTVRDWNGYDDVNMTNATLWDDDSVNMGDVDDENNHYTNSSCTNVGNDGTYLSYWQCAFDVYYYANNGSNWKCNATALDDSNFTDSNYNTTTINPLYALNISTQSIDYGDVPVEGTSDNQTADVINFGNMDINVSLWGYAKNPGDNLAFNCSLNGNISIGNERYGLNPVDDWNAKTNLSSTATDLGLTITKQTALGVPKQNTTYWQVYIPADENPAGFCTGNVVFEATAP